MNRREFANKTTRWGLGLILAGLAIALSRKVVLKTDCNGCPEYAACSGVDNCTVDKIADNEQD